MAPYRNGGARALGEGADAGAEREAVVVWVGSRSAARQYGVRSKPSPYALAVRRLLRSLPGAGTPHDGTTVRVRARGERSHRTILHAVRAAHGIELAGAEALLRVRLAGQQHHAERGTRREHEVPDPHPPRDLIWPDLTRRGHERRTTNDARPPLPLPPSLPPSLPRTASVPGDGELGGTGSRAAAAAAVAVTRTETETTTRVTVSVSFREIFSLRLVSERASE